MSEKLPIIFNNSLWLSPAAAGRAVTFSCWRDTKVMSIKDNFGKHPFPAGTSIPKGYLQEKTG